MQPISYQCATFCALIFFNVSRREYTEVFTESSVAGDDVHMSKAPMAFNHGDSPHLHEVREVLDEYVVSYFLLCGLLIDMHPSFPQAVILQLRPG